ncbi:MAG: hypothetical protein AAGA66_05620 [Bacteroidota bacterium]
MPDHHTTSKPELQKAYDALLATIPEIEQKGKNNPYTSYNGHMYTFLAKEGYIAIRLPKAVCESFLEKYDTTLATSYGAVMKEYVVVPDSMINQTTELADYLQQSFDYVKTLKPKPSKKKGTNKAKPN